MQSLYPEGPTVEIIEQPKCIRFLFSREVQETCVNNESTRDNDCTYPTIRINNYSGRAIIVVSCITKDSPYRVHPNGLVGPGTTDGLIVERQTINQKSTLSFGCRIQRTHTNKIAEELTKRAQVRVPELNMYNPELRIDPFEHGFDHAKEIKREDVNAVRLAVQAFVQNRQGAWGALEPALSDPIYDERSRCSSLQIRWVSDSTGVFTGDETVVIELYKTAAQETEVVFFEESEGGEKIWLRRANIMIIHNNMIVLKTPPFHRVPEKNTKTYFVVRRLSDNQCSEPWSFQYNPRRQVLQEKNITNLQVTRQGVEPSGFHKMLDMPMDLTMDVRGTLDDEIMLRSISPRSWVTYCD